MLSQAITNFHDNLARIRRADYNETEVRVQFINPLFEALGWDMRDTGGRREVASPDEWCGVGSRAGVSAGRTVDRLHLRSCRRARPVARDVDGRRWGTT